MNDDEALGHFYADSIEAAPKLPLEDGEMNPDTKFKIRALVWWCEAEQVNSMTGRQITKLNS